jgi:hypothetical protein
MVGLMILAGLNGQHLKDIKFDNSATFWLGVSQANPSLGITIHPDNIRAVLSDPEDIVRTEVLCQWVDTIKPSYQSVSVGELQS